MLSISKKPNCDIILKRDYAEAIATSLSSIKCKYINFHAEKILQLIKKNVNCDYNYTFNAFDNDIYILISILNKNFKLYIFELETKESNDLIKNHLLNFLKFKINAKKKLFNHLHFLRKENSGLSHFLLQYKTKRYLPLNNYKVVKNKVHDTNYMLIFNVDKKDLDKHNTKNIASKIIRSIVQENKIKNADDNNIKIIYKLKTNNRGDKKTLQRNDININSENFKNFFVTDSGFIDDVLTNSDGVDEKNSLNNEHDEIFLFEDNEEDNYEIIFKDLERKINF